MEELKKTSFTRTEYERRLAKAQEEMNKAGIDLLLCHNMSSICYFTGFQTLGSYGFGYYSAIIPSKGKPILFSSPFEVHNARIFCWTDEIIAYDVSILPIRALVDLLNERGWSRSRIGYESGFFSLRVSDYDILKESAPDAVFVDATRLIDSVRLVKSEEEISVLRKSAKLTSDAMKAAFEALCEGAYDNDLAAEAYRRAVKNGAEYFSLQPIVTTGKRSGIPHSTFRRTLIEKGDHVFMEVSAAYERYSAPAMRTMSLGKPADEVIRAFDACRSSVLCVRSMLRDGANGRDAAIAASSLIRKAVPHLLWHGCHGYSVGLNFPPGCSDMITLDFEVKEAYDFTVRSGMVFHCSTSLRDIGRYGATFSETILVTDTGCEALTSLPQEMMIK